MVQVYSNTDFALYLPYYLAGIDFGENSTLKISLYTINRDVSYSVTIPANPIPVYINIEGKELSFMESGVIRCLLTLSQPNVEFSDGVCDKTFVFTTDMFYNRPSANVVFENFYTKSETQQIIDELEATIASEYPDSIEMETFVTENTSTFIKESSVPGAACQIVNFKQNNIGGSFAVDIIQQNNLWNKAVDAFKKGKTIVFRCTKYGDNYTFYQGMPQVYYADNSYTVSKFVCTIMDSKNSSFTITWSYNGSGYSTTTDFTNYQETDPPMTIHFNNQLYYITMPRAGENAIEVEFNVFDNNGNNVTAECEYEIGFREDISGAIQDTFAYVTTHTVGGKNHWYIGAEMWSGQSKENWDWSCMTSKLYIQATHTESDATCKANIETNPPEPIDDGE